MNKKSIMLSLAAALSLTTTLPSYAADSALGGIASFFGSTTAVILDVPQGIIVDTLWRSPLKTQRNLAEKFGDEKGFQQNVAAAVIGVPVGMVWGVPAGALRGAKHGMGTGWEKPFSTESFVVGLGEDK
ncbi:MAG: hypothetical protein K2W95_24485 [Candidatus Obscuribacterales bacterium]|nr:hypothetical protein [Candidatus Obscuribacterales bacterium]